MIYTVGFQGRKAGNMGYGIDSISLKNYGMIEQFSSDRFSNINRINEAVISNQLGTLFLKN